MSKMTLAIKTTLIAASVALSAFSLNAQAALTSYTSGGQEVVYSSVSNVTWTKDANLLGSMITSQGFTTVVNNILSVSPTISNTPNFLSPTGTYSLASSINFSIDGRVTWFGAMAFINYLNSTNYAGSNQWRLPTVANTSFGTNTATNGTTAGDELTELFYSELGGTANRAIPNTATFDNEQANAYWSGTEYASDPRGAWGFFTNGGAQGFDFKNRGYYAWAVSPGQIAAPSAVPIPAAAWLFGSGLVGLAGMRRRKQQA
jgi:hypothetical protein